MELRFVEPQSPDYAMLAKKLDEYYYTLVGDVHLRYADVNRPENMACRIVVYHEEQPVACGCWKPIDEQAGEVKRIYVLPQYRRRGLASRIIARLEEEIAASGRSTAILETARTTEDSRQLYLSLGYELIDYYGSPAGAENCLCFRKCL